MSYMWWSIGPIEVREVAEMLLTRDIIPPRPSSVGPCGYYFDSKDNQRAVHFCSRARDWSHLERSENIPYAADVETPAQAEDLFRWLNPPEKETETP